jgi:hypothetical protein
MNTALGDFQEREALMMESIDMLSRQNEDLSAQLKRALTTSSHISQESRQGINFIYLFVLSSLQSYLSLFRLLANDYSPLPKGRPPRPHDARSNTDGSAYPHKYRGGGGGIYGKKKNDTSPQASQARVRQQKKRRNNRNRNGENLPEILF